MPKYSLPLDTTLLTAIKRTLEESSDKEKRKTNVTWIDSHMLMSVLIEVICLGNVIKYSFLAGFARFTVNNMII